MAAMANLVVRSVSPQDTGLASGMNTNIRTIGGAIGAAVMTSIVTAGAGKDGLPKLSAYEHGWWFLAVMALTAAFAVIYIPAAYEHNAGSAEIHVAASKAAGTG